MKNYWLVMVKGNKIRRIYCSPTINLIIYLARLNHSNMKESKDNFSNGFQDQVTFSFFFTTPIHFLLNYLTINDFLLILIKY